MWLCSSGVSHRGGGNWRLLWGVFLPRPGHSTLFLSTSPGPSSGTWPRLTQERLESAVQLCTMWRRRWAWCFTRCPFHKATHSGGSRMTSGMIFSSECLQVGWEVVIILSVVLYIFYQADWPSGNITASRIPGVIAPLWKVALNFLNLSVESDKNKELLCWTVLIAVS